ncbi:unnamed protein product [Dracunculus medinensis]|uniref:Dynactin domain-containing protein n=1 Tax=Dracunculus medinensis TaxID=318479 RepID=A0A158Q4P0_DRAME|nr:unnamed protein product [Dracunculus medinensis]
MKEGEARQLEEPRIVDRLNRNSDLKEIEEEIVEIKSRNNGAEKTLEELFDERHQKEKIIEELEKEIDQEKVKHKAILDHMNASFIAEEYRLKQQELSELHQNKYEIDKELANSVLKQQAMILHEQLTEIQLKKTKIIAEIDAEETPEQQREQLMKMIVQITEEIAAIQKQVNTVNEKIKQSSEELREFQTEFENLAGEKNEKYHELKIKEAQIDEFLNSYDDTKSELNERIAKLSENIVNLLELISINCEVTNINLNNATDMSQLDNELASAFDLKNLHVSLQEELISLNELEVKLLGEAEKTEQRICEMMKQIEEIDDPRNLKEEIKQRCQLVVLIFGCYKIVQKMINQEVIIKFQINLSNYQLKNAQKKWQYVEQNNYISREAITAREIETSYQNLKAEASYSRFLHFSRSLSLFIAQNSTSKIYHYFTSD